MPGHKMVDLYYKKSDGKKFTLEILLANISIILCMIMNRIYDIPIWMIAIIINISLIRWMLAIHELFHIHKYDETNFLVRLSLVPLSPINVGYKEYRKLHFGHHRNTAGEQDPDFFHIGGGHVRSFIGSFFFPEGSTIIFLKDNSKSANWMDMGIRLLLFVSLAFIGGIHFWIVLLILRIHYCIGIWTFFHHLHYRSGKYGTFSLPLPRLLKFIFGFLYGKPAILATMHHDVHHKCPKIAAIYLDRVHIS